MNGKSGSKYILKTEITNNKKVIEQLSVIMNNYKENKQTQGLSDNEVKKRVHDLDEIILRYRNIKAFHDDPSVGVVNLRDIEN